MDLNGLPNEVANALTPDWGPVPPAQVQSSIPNWFSPNSWMQSVGGMAGSVEAWWGDSTLNPSHVFGVIATDVSDAGHSVMSNVSSHVKAVTSSINEGVQNTTSLLKWLAILLIAVAALYLLGMTRGVLPGEQG